MQIHCLSDVAHLLQICCDLWDSTGYNRFPHPGNSPWPPRPAFDLCHFSIICILHTISDQFLLLSARFVIAAGPKTQNRICSLWSGQCRCGAGDILGKWKHVDWKQIEKPAVTRAHFSGSYIPKPVQKSEIKTMVHTLGSCILNANCLVSISVGGRSGNSQVGVESRRCRNGSRAPRQLDIMANMWGPGRSSPCTAAVVAVVNNKR